MVGSGFVLDEVGQQMPSEKDKVMTVGNPTDISFVYCTEGEWR